MLRKLWLAYGVHYHPFHKDAPSNHTLELKCARHARLKAAAGVIVPNATKDHRSPLTVIDEAISMTSDRENDDSTCVWNEHFPSLSILDSGLRFSINAYQLDRICPGLQIDDRDLPRDLQAGRLLRNDAHHGGPEPHATVYAEIRTFWPPVIGHEGELLGNDLEGPISIRVPKLSMWGASTSVEVLNLQRWKEYLDIHTFLDEASIDPGAVEVDIQLRISWCFDRNPVEARYEGETPRSLNWDDLFYTYCLGTSDNHTFSDDLADMIAQNPMMDLMQISQEFRISHARWNTRQPKIIVEAYTINGARAAITRIYQSVHRIYSDYTGVIPLADHLTHSKDNQLLYLLYDGIYVPPKDGHELKRWDAAHERWRALQWMQLVENGPAPIQGVYHEDGTEFLPGANSKTGLPHIEPGIVPGLDDPTSTYFLFDFPATGERSILLRSADHFWKIGDITDFFIKIQWMGINVVRWMHSSPLHFPMLLKQTLNTIHGPRCSTTMNLSGDYCEPGSAFPNLCKDRIYCEHLASMSHAYSHIDLERTIKQTASNQGVDLIIQIPIHPRNLFVFSNPEIQQNAFHSFQDCDTPPCTWGKAFDDDARLRLRAIIDDLLPLNTTHLDFGLDIYTERDQSFVATVLQEAITYILADFPEGVLDSRWIVIPLSTLCAITSHEFFDDLLQFKLQIMFSNKESEECRVLGQEIIDSLELDDSVHKRFKIGETISEPFRCLDVNYYSQRQHLGCVKEDTYFPIHCSKFHNTASFKCPADIEDEAAYIKQYPPWVHMRTPSLSRYTFRQHPEAILGVAFKEIMVNRISTGVMNWYRINWIHVSAISAKLWSMGLPFRTAPTDDEYLYDRFSDLDHALMERLAIHLSVTSTRKNPTQNIYGRFCIPGFEDLEPKIIPTGARRYCRQAAKKAIEFSKAIHRRKQSGYSNDGYFYPTDYGDLKQRSRLGAGL